MFKNLNLQYLFSYCGLIPFFILTIDKYFFNQIKEEININFTIYYTLVIYVFIGSINWNLENRVKYYIIIHGFLPSLIATLVITLNLYNFNKFYLLSIIIFSFLFQLLIDFLIMYNFNYNKKPFYFLRLPLTTAIVFFIFFNLF